jgi:hypothetical protein
MAHAVLDGLTATAGGGQATAAPLSSGVHRFSTVATAADSCRLPPAASGAVGVEVNVINAGAASLNVFPAPGDTINALAANAAFALPAGKTCKFLSTGAGRWYSLLSA